MFKLSAAALAAVAYANEPHLVPSNSIAINQLSGQENFVKLDDGTYADPDPVQKASTEYFHVRGTWITASGADLDHVQFICNMQGQKVFDESIACDATSAADGCVKPLGKAGEIWESTFNFPVPPIAPPFLYDVHVIGQTAAGDQLFELQAQFTI